MYIESTDIELPVHHYLQDMKCISSTGRGKPCSSMGCTSNQMDSRPQTTSKKSSTAFLSSVADFVRVKYLIGIYRAWEKNCWNHKISNWGCENFLESALYSESPLMTLSYRSWVCAVCSSGGRWVGDKERGCWAAEQGARGGGIRGSLQGNSAAKGHGQVVSTEKRTRERATFHNELRGGRQNAKRYL